jgi:hypothetical protein
MGGSPGDDGSTIGDRGAGATEWQNRGRLVALLLHFQEIPQSVELQF